MTLKDIYKKSLISELGIAALPDEQKVEILNSAAELVEVRFVELLTEQLDAEALKELGSLLGSVDESTWQSFVDTHSLDADELYGGALNDVVETMKSSAAEAKKELTEDSLQQIGK